MSIYRIRKDIDFKVTENEVLVKREHFNEYIEDCSLRFIDKGLFFGMMALNKPEFTVYDLMVLNSDGEEAIYNSFMRLIENGYIEKVKLEKGEGFIYIIGDYHGSYKIGLASDIAKRFKAFYTHMPYGPEIIKIIRTKNMQQLEKELHKAFKEKHINKEWFKLDKLDLEYLKTIY